MLTCACCLCLAGNVLDDEDDAEVVVTECRWRFLRCRQADKLTLPPVMTELANCFDARQALRAPSCIRVLSFDPYMRSCSERWRFFASPLIWSMPIVDELMQGCCSTLLLVVAAPLLTHSLDCNKLGFILLKYFDLFT